MKNNFLKLMEYIKKSVKSQSEINYLKKKSTYLDQNKCAKNQKQWKIIRAVKPKQTFKERKFDWQLTTQ